MPMPAQKLGPRRNVQSWNATSVWPATVSDSASAPANCWRRVTTDSTLTMPATMSVDSTMRLAT
ncbi:MAG TPA: hypothetical protein VH418_12745 [Solirubrobacteraceae bacterium]